MKDNKDFDVILPNLDKKAAELNKPESDPFLQLLGGICDYLDGMKKHIDDRFDKIENMLEQPITSNFDNEKREISYRRQKDGDEPAGTIRT